MKKIFNENGNAYIWLIFFIVIFIGISTLVIDYGNLYVKTKKIKDAMNRSVKAASLQIKHDEVLIDGLNGKELAEGVFVIDELKAKETFKGVIADNLGLDRITLEPSANSILFEKPIIKELEVINNVPVNYTSPTISNTYQIVNPSVIAVIEFKIHGLFLKTNIIVDKLSSSQLTDIYD